MGEDQPFYALEPRRRHTSVVGMAQAYVRAMVGVCPPPYIVGGFSFGCVVAYEMARQLEAKGVRCEVYMLDGRAPTTLPEAMGWDLDAYVMCVLCRGAKQFLGFHVDVGYDELAPLSADQRLLAIAAKVIAREDALRNISPAVAANFFLRFQRDLRDSEDLVRGYHSSTHHHRHKESDDGEEHEEGARLRARVTLIKASRPPHIRGLHDALLHDEMLGWGAYCENVRTLHVDGDHEELVFTPVVESVAEVMREALRPST